MQIIQRRYCFYEMILSFSECEIWFSFYYDVSHCSNFFLKLHLILNFFIIE